MPDEIIDFNKIVAELVNQNIDKFYSTGKDILKGAADSIRLRLGKSYKAYLSCVADRYSKGKSFFIRNEPTYLYSFYVPMGVVCGKKIIPRATISQLSSINRFVILVGSAGSGKSMMMRHLFLDTITSKEKVPLFIELRGLNQTQRTLHELIQETLLSNRFEIDNDYIEKALKAGHFALFFDGFDEVAIALRKSISNQLQQLAKNYDQNIIVVSSRPDPEFSGWQLFSVLELSPLTLEQACTLVEKLPFDSELKVKFLGDLKESLFKKHRSFLSNPLLLSIMLLTYGMSADIPNKLSVFYNQAYEALFQRHDALKGGYQRDRSCNLDIQDFAKVFAAFSVQTYDVRAFQFSRSEALQYIEKTKNILNFEFNANDYLKDALQAVCLLIEDGLMINFSHRSFQEFFTAKFIADANPQVQQKLINKHSNKMKTDNVIDLLYEMKPEIVETLYIIQGLSKLEEIIGLKRQLGIQHYVRLLKSDFSSIYVEGEYVKRLSGNKTDYFFGLIQFTLNHCGDLVRWPGYDSRPIKLSTETNCPVKISSSTDLVKKGPTELLIGASKSSDNLFRQLAQGHHILSMQAVDYALKTKKALIEKHERIDRSLDEIFAKH